MNPVESRASPEMSGIPPVITTAEKCDEDGLGMSLHGLHISIDPSLFDKSNDLEPNEKDASTADETSEENSAGFSSGNGSQDSDCSDDDSTRSHQTNKSTRLLLKQAQQRVHQQSVYEDVKALRAEVSQYKTSLETALDQKLASNKRCSDLESQLAKAMEIIQDYKLEELRLVDERAEREKDFMNQLNDLSSTTETTEQNMMAEIIKRDHKIIDLQNLWNDEEMKRMKLARERRKAGVAAVRVEAQEVVEVDLDDDSWGDDCSSEFI